MGKKVVLDTNLLISALGWKGKPREIFDKAIRGKFKLVISTKQLAELSETMDYPKLGFTEEQKLRFLALVLEISSLIEPKEKLTIIKEDPDDNEVLECAVSCNADYIISGDRHLLKLKEFKGIKILTAKKFLNIIK
jgi:putative PIN family toxin of toxin-antitoxin system